MLRSPLLMENVHWISSMSICLTAAQRIIAIYMDIFQPAIRAVNGAESATYSVADRRYLQEATRLPLTWRQVRRISASALVIVYAFWKGEASYEDTGKAIASALLLLDFQSLRWGRHITSIRKTLLDLAAFNSLSLHDCIKYLVPNIDTTHLTRVAGTGTRNYQEPQPASVQPEFEDFDPNLPMLQPGGIWTGSLLGNFSI